MAPNRRAAIVNRFHQADARIVQAQEYLAVVRATLLADHPDDARVILKILVCLDAARDGIREVAMTKYTRTPRNLLKARDLDRIVAQAKPIPDIHYASQDWAAQKRQPSRSPENLRRRRAARKARLQQAATET